MPDRSLLREYTAVRLDTYRGRPVDVETGELLYDLCAAGIAQEERAPGSTGANYFWWAAELLCWYDSLPAAGIPPITPKGVR